MSRPLRLELAGGVYHVTSRGDRQEKTMGSASLTDVCEYLLWAKMNCLKVYNFL